MRHDWFTVLEAARGLSPDSNHPFTAPGLAEILRCPGREASGWLYKFKRWGYVEVTGQVQGNSIRPLNVFVVTEKGHACKPRESRERQLALLVGAVRAYERARGAKGETAAWKALLKVCKEVEE